MGGWGFAVCDVCCEITAVPPEGRQLGARAHTQGFFGGGSGWGRAGGALDSILVLVLIPPAALAAL